MYQDNQFNQPQANQSNNQFGSETRAPKPKIYLSQLTLKQGKYGQYFSGKLGMTWVTLSVSKNNPEKWNLYVEQADLEQNQNAPQGNAGF